MSVQFAIAKAADWIKIFGALLNEIGGEKSINFPKPELSDFFWKGGKLLIKKRMGRPSTPIQGQPNLHNHYSYIDIYRHVKNFIQKLNYIHNPLKPMENKA